MFGLRATRRGKRKKQVSSKPTTVYYRRRPSLYNITQFYFMLQLRSPMCPLKNNNKVLIYVYYFYNSI